MGICNPFFTYFYLLGRKLLNIIVWTNFKQKIVIKYNIFHKRVGTYNYIKYYYKL